MPCTVRIAAGDAGSRPFADGSSGSDCSLTYNAYDLNGAQIGWAVTPETFRYPKVEYHRPANDSPGVGFWRYAAGSSDQFVLVWAAEEYPVCDWAINVTQMQVNTSTLKIQVKTRRELVLEESVESDWTDVHTGNQCPA